MSFLLAATEGTALPINSVGWAVTILGLVLAVAWTAYLYR